MSAILPVQKILTTSTNFYKIPGIQTWDLPALIPAPHSGGASSVSSTASATYRNIDREEPCFITKSSCYTHERVHWINAVKKNPEVKEQVEELLKGRAIVYPNFVLDSVVNLANMDRVLHAALDKYAFFAVTGSSNTLKELISMLEKDNGRRQAHFDATGLNSSRILDFSAPVFVNPQYELVALWPGHLLPNGKVLVTYSQEAGGQVSRKTYVPGEDHTLREFPGNLSCPRFPPFSFDSHRPDHANPNPFLVILNAEIKFRRYLRQQPSPPLPADPMTLIQLTTELVKLIYWDPIVKPNTPAAQIFLNTSPILAPEAQPSDVEMGYGEDEGEVPTLRTPHRNMRRWVAHTLKERMDYGQYLLSGRDPVFDDDENLAEQLSPSYQGTPSHRIEEVWAWRNTVEV